MRIRIAILAIATLASTSCGPQTAKNTVNETQPASGADANLRSEKAPVQRPETKAAPPAVVFLAILQDAKKQTQLPILLPSELPDSYRGLAALVADANKYSISLLTEVDGGRSIAEFMAEKEETYSAADIGNTKRVTLAKNTIGFFRPISCGGSCAPVNLWWEDDGILYNIQTVMPSDTPEDEQQKLIVPIADSAILGGPR